MAFFAKLLIIKKIPNICHAVERQAAMLEFIFNYRFCVDLSACIISFHVLSELTEKAECLFITHLDEHKSLM